MKNIQTNLYDLISAMNEDCAGNDRLISLIIRHMAASGKIKWTSESTKSSMEIMNQANEKIGGWEPDSCFV
jgi:hypothetical protein